MPPSRICYSPDSPVHGVHQSIYPSLDKLWLHGAGRYPAGKLGDAVAQMELQPAGGVSSLYLTPVK